MIIIGDLHGEIAKLEKILKKFKGEKFLFIGDYLDSFTATDRQIIDTLLLVLKAGDIILLGNHELNYHNGWGNAGYCSGYRITLQKEVQSILRKNEKKFKFLHYDSEKDILYTHAGISAKWYENHEPNFSKETLREQINQWEQINPFDLPRIDPMFDVGYARRGNAVYGGPLWCDWFNDFRHFDLCRCQIFGHTPIKEISLEKNYDVPTNYAWNIDCLLQNNQVLEVPDEKLPLPASISEKQKFYETKIEIQKF